MIRFLILAVLLAPVMVKADEVCVVNGTNDRYFFVVETRGGSRDTGNLIASGRLCVEAASGSKGGVITVFAKKEDPEGCSRLVPNNSSESLLRYEAVDRCTWSSQPRGTRR